jgi:hypothetical protein
MSFSRALGVNVSVFTIGGQVYIGDLMDASITLNTVTDESKAVKDAWSIPTAYKRNYSIDGTVAVNTSAATVMTKFLTGTQVAFTYTTGDGTYTGNALITKCDHKLTKGLQTFQVTLAGQGILDRADPV